jgi:hypothetical protein
MWQDPLWYFLGGEEETQPIRKVKYHNISIIFLGLLIQSPVTDVRPN